MLKEILFKILPRSWYVAYVNRKYEHFEKMDTKAVFSEVYKRKLWDSKGESGSEFCSGSGTLNDNTAKYISFLTDFISKKEIKDLVEVGCGDFRIMQKVTSSVTVNSYTGIDVVPDLIAFNQQNFGSHNIHFVCLNAVTNELPVGDCLIIRQVLQHLSNGQISQILQKAAAYKYVLITEHVSLKPRMLNRDKVQGPETRLNNHSGVFIERSPFNMKNVETVLEYREDHKLMNENIEAILRTSLITHTL